MRGEKERISAESVASKMPSMQNKCGVELIRILDSVFKNGRLTSMKAM